MKISAKLACCFALVAVFCASTSHACRAEVCRRKRDVTRESGDDDVTRRDGVVMETRGCSGAPGSASWLRKVTWCLGVDAVHASLVMDGWFRRLSRGKCSEVCRNVIDESCVRCFTSDPQLADVASRLGVDMPSLISCVDRFVVDDVITKKSARLVAVSNDRGSVKIPTTSKLNKWFSLTVKLPCKPPVFKFWNTMCVDAFGTGDGGEGYVMAQNRLMTSHDMQFYVIFDDKCRFDMDQVEILWDRSVPGFALPQVSATHGRIEEDDESGVRHEIGQIVFDVDAYDKLIRPLEGAASNHQIGFKFSCRLESFKVFDDQGFPVPVASGDEGRRHVISSLAFAGTHVTKLTFDAAYRGGAGDECEGADVSAVRPEVDPEWESSMMTSPLASGEGAKHAAYCLECSGASSEEECDRNGVLQRCADDQQCVTATKFFSSTRKSVTRSCHRDWICSSHTSECNRSRGQLCISC